jgi:uncharacterized protein YfaS (alpha-2-macroglobulin family)
MKSSMKKQIVLFSFLLFFIQCCTAQNNPSMTSFNYEKAWKQVTEHENKGLPESALKVVDEIYSHAKQEKNTGQLVKAVIHQLKFVNYKEEDGFVKNLNRLKTEAQQATFPTKPLLHSMLGEMYWQYYQANRYEFLNRSETINTDDNDIETWSLARIVQETFTQYHLSLADVERSKTEKLDIYEPVIHKGNDLGERYRPTLYDFLAHRAVDFFALQEPGLTRPAYAFSINQENYIAPAADFVDIKITSNDSLSTEFYALTILQDLIRFHLNDEDPAALVDVDLRRLQFVKTHLTLPTKQALYLNALEHLEKNVIENPIVGRVTVEKARLFVETGALYKPLQSEEHKWDLKKAFEICEACKKRFPDAEAAISCENLQTDIKNKSISAVVEETNIPNQAFRSLVRYHNFTDLHYRIVKINREEVDALRKKLEKDYSSDNEKKFISYFTAKTALKHGQFKLPDDGDYQRHSIEVKLDAVPEGEYIVLYSHKPDFSTQENALAYAFTVVSNISYIHRTMKDGGTEFHVLHRESGKAMSGVNATVYTYIYNNAKGIYQAQKLGSYRSDATGYFNIPLIKNDRYLNFFVNFSSGNDFNSTEPIDRGGYYHHGSISQYRTHEPESGTQTFFFLDRAIYRPGQTIYFKGLVIDSDGKNPQIKTNYKTILSLIDVNGQEREKITVTTNEYGTFSGTFAAPSSGLTGEMQIRNQDGSGNTAFSVEEYKRPKFEVGFDPVKGVFKLNDVVTVEGFARAYSGATIDGASVTYRVVRVVNFPFWWWCRWGYYPPSPDMEITNGVLQSDAAGKFKIDFTAIPDRSVDAASDPTFTYTIYADVTDINGETHSSSTSVSVGYKSLLVSVPVDNINKDFLAAPGYKKELDIRTTNLAGEFQGAQGDIKIYLLRSPERAFRTRLWEEPDRMIYTREEYYKLFPNDLYDHENDKFKWARDKQVFSAAFDTNKRKTVEVSSLNTWSNGEYVLEITAKDKEGRDVREVTYFSVYAPSSKLIPTKEVNYFQAIKINAEPGEEASFVAGTSLSPIHVLYEIERDGQILTKEWVTLSNEQRLFEILIKEEYRGNLGIHYTFTRNNRLYAQSFAITVPFTNKMLDISFESFRDKLQPGQQEQWKILVKGRTADKLAAEMVAALYDESLDEFRANTWYASFYNATYARLGWKSVNGFSARELQLYTEKWNPDYERSVQEAYFASLNWFGYSFYNTRWLARNADSDKRAAPMMAMKSEAANEKETQIVFEESVVAYGEGRLKTEGPEIKDDQQAIKKENLSEVKIRKNFNETAFFYPHLQTNEKGEIVISFTIPEALTRWKMLGFAHTQDMKSGYTTNHLVTQKDIMVVPNQPRFFRENDKMKFSVKVSSLVDKELNGQAQLQFFDALTMKPVDALMKNTNGAQNFSLKSRQSTNLEWSIEIPEGVQAIMYRVVAKAGDFSDGEEMVIPVITNRMLVTETLPLPIRGNQTKEFRFEKLLSNKSNTLRHQRYTLEFTSNPAWYAIQALPYLMEYPYDCVEQTFSKFYANSIASHVANSNPRIKQVFDTWKNIQPDALLSNLEKNQELKSALLEETPWVLQAKDESQRKRMVGVLFDLNRMSNELDRALDKVMKAQQSSGGFSWFPGFPEDRYMTQHIVAGMGHLDVMGVKSIRTDNKSWNMVINGLLYMDSKMKADYDRLKELARAKQIKLEDNHISYINFHYLYTRSYFTTVEVPASCKEAFDYFIGQAKKYWLSNNLYLQGMACLALNRFGDKAVTGTMIKSFSERALRSEEMGMYWKNDRGYYWHQAPIETQALMIEVYDEVTADAKSVEDMKVWLLKQKQTTDWKTTKATVEACYALLRRGTDVLANTKMVDIKVGNEVIDPTKRADTKIEAGTGYFKTAWQAGEVKEDMGKITVSKSDDGVAWGAVYWQYFEQLDKITPAETPLKLKKDLFLQQNTDRGPVITPVNDKSSFHVGDLVKVKIELRVDRDMEYVHLKDMRAAGFEPVSTLSTFKYQDGLYYYESPRDLAMNFFMGYLPKGTYVFEYALRVSQKGNFSNGITTIQCMYAPEFTSHSQGIRVDIK